MSYIPSLENSHNGNNEIPDGNSLQDLGQLTEEEVSAVSIQSPIETQYRAEAERKGIRPVEQGEWLDVDGVRYQLFADVESEVDPSTDEENLETRKRLVGTYDINNSTVAYVREDGRVIVGHATLENIQALENAGYRRGRMWVPFSNGEVPTDEKVRQAYLEMRERGLEHNKRVRVKEHLDIYASEAQRKNVREVGEGIWMEVDGIEYTFSRTDRPSQIPSNTDGYNIPSERVQQVGTFDSNNGMIAFVDSRGKLHVGASTKENYEALMKAGYSRGSMWVPFSNGESPTDEETRQQLRDVCTGKPAEILKAERTAKLKR